MNRWQIHGIILCIYIALAAAMTWPVVAQLETHVAGTGGDPWQTMWRFETKADSGFAGLFQDITGQAEAQLVNLSVWPWMPLHILFGEPTGYNLIWLLSFVLSGYGMYVLVRVLTVSMPSPHRDTAAFLAGVAYMFLPYHVAHSFGHFGAMQMQWLPLIVATFVAWWRRPSFLKAVTIIALFIIQAWSEHHYALWLTILAFIAGLAWHKHLRHAPAAQRRWLIATIVIALLMAGVAYIPTAQLALQDTSPLELGREQLLRFSADPFSFIVPASFHPAWGKVTGSLFSQHFTGNVSESTHYLGVVVLLISLFFHQLIPMRIKKFWLIAAITFFVVSLGPRLHVLGNVTSIPLPYELLDELPVFSAIRAISRAGVMVGLATCTLFGLVLATQLRRTSSAVVIALLLLLDFLFAPVPTQSAAIPAVYEKLASLPGSAVLEIPAATNYTIASRALYGSTVHGKEVLGNIALERAHTEDELAEIKQLPGVRQLLYLRTTELRQDRNEFFNQELAETLPDAMASQGAQAIIVHPDSLSVLQWTSIRRFLEEDLGLTPQPIEDIVLYEVMRGAGNDGVVLARSDGWENIGLDTDRGAVFAEIPQTATATLFNVTTGNTMVELKYEVAPESTSTVAVVIAGQLVNGAFPLPPGRTEVQFIASGAEKAIIMNPELIVKTAQ